MENIILFAGFLMFIAFAKAEHRDVWLKTMKNRKSVVCISVKNVTAVSKAECAIQFVHDSNANLADFNARLLTCEFKFCNQINNDTFKACNGCAAIFQSYSKYINSLH